MSKTVIGVYETRVQAEEAKQDLLDAGIPENEVTVSKRSDGGEQTEEAGFWQEVKGWLGFEDAAYYEEGARRGATILAANVDDDRTDLAVSAIQRHDPIDIDTEAKRWQQEGWNAPHFQSPSETRQVGSVESEESIPLAEEQLKVGKRREQRGGTRIYTHVTETPVEEQVQLTDEHVDVERRRVDKPADESAFQERTVEATETHEEPVVSKEARATEEVVLHKEREQHAETVRDTVRRTEVDIERIDEEDFRHGFETRQGQAAAYDEHRPAYQFGRQLALDDRYRDRSWDSVEPDAKREFEAKYPGAWGRYKDTVREAFEFVRGRTTTR